MWANITVGKYQQLYDIIQGQNFASTLDRQVRLLACLTDKPVDYFETMPIRDLINKEVPKLAFLSVGEPPAVSTPPNTVTVGGKSFRFIYEFQHLAAGQFIDAMAAARIPEERVLNINKLLAAIAVPVTRSWINRVKVRPYGYIPYDEVAILMLELPITDAMAVTGFFFSAWNSFLKAIPGCLERKMLKGLKLTPTEQQMYELAVLASETGGDG